MFAQVSLYKFHSHPTFFIFIFNLGPGLILQNLFEDWYKGYQGTLSERDQSDSQLNSKRLNNQMWFFCLFCPAQTIHLHGLLNFILFECLLKCEFMQPVQILSIYEKRHSSVPVNKHYVSETSGCTKAQGHSVCLMCNVL